MLYFGMHPDPRDPLGLPVERPPKGTVCEHCDEAITDSDRGVVKPLAICSCPDGFVLAGVARHWECEVHVQLGSAGHIRFEAHLARSDDIRDAPNLTTHEAAQAAARAFDEADALSVN